MSELSLPELRAWLARTVDEAYHSPNEHHTFDECGDPFCVDAQKLRDQVLAYLVQAPPEPGGTE